MSALFEPDPWVGSVPVGEPPAALLAVAPPRVCLSCPDMAASPAIARALRRSAAICAMAASRACSSSAVADKSTAPLLAVAARAATSGCAPAPPPPAPAPALAVLAPAPAAPAPALAPTRGAELPGAEACAAAAARRSASSFALISAFCAAESRGRPVLEPVQWKGVGEVGAPWYHARLWERRVCATYSCEAFRCFGDGSGPFHGA